MHKCKINVLYMYQPYCAHTHVTFVFVTTHTSLESGHEAWIRRRRVQWHCHSSSRHHQHVPTSQFPRPVIKRARLFVPQALLPTDGAGHGKPGNHTPQNQ